MAESTVSVVKIGVGLDTARYGHHANFYGEDRHPAARDFAFAESRDGYERFQAALARLADRHQGNVHFNIRLDAAGNYAANLEAFLRQLPFSKTISVGEPKRNKDYRNAHFPKRKSDQVDSLACARFAIVEQPPETAVTPAPFLMLKELAGALQGQRKHTTRRVNQLHNHLARTFPELALLAPEVSVGWVLKLLDEYPTPQRIAAARQASLTKIPHISEERAEKLQNAARTSVASLTGELAEALVRHAVRQVQQSQQEEVRLSKLLEQAFDTLPDGGHRQLLTIPGIGQRTAAALVAKIVSIDRFETPAKLVNYFGGFPEENTSGVDKKGNPIPQGTLQMSPKGNDLVRGLLWMACQSAIQCNPAIRALYARQRAVGKRGDVALGHCVRKMLHLVYAVWKTNRPFDPDHFPWEPRPKTVNQTATEAPAGRPIPDPASESSTLEEPAQATPAIALPQDNVSAAQKDAAGHKGENPTPKVVTATSLKRTTRTVSQSLPVGKQIHFAELRSQLNMTDVLKLAGVLQTLRGQGFQRTGPCPFHQPQQTTGNQFSVNLQKKVFRCFNPECNAHGNVLDFWATLKQLSLTQAAVDLANQFEITLPLRNQTQNTTNKSPKKPPEKSSVITQDAT